MPEYRKNSGYFGAAYRGVVNRFDENEVSPA